MAAATLREVWDRDEASIGGWCLIPSAFVAELMGRYGFDWVCIDTQHGLMGHGELVSMLQALAITDTPGIVRVAQNVPHLIGRALDAGAQGVIVPMVNSPQEAQAAVSSCRYSPGGSRSWGPVRASLGIDGYNPALADRRTICAVMIETRTAVESVDDILDVQGIDAVYIGPNDLAMSYGHAPSSGLDEPERAAIEKVLAACTKRGIAPGIHCPDTATAIAWRAVGFKWFTVSGDAGFLKQSALEVLATFRAGSVAPTASGIRGNY